MTKALVTTDCNDRVLTLTVYGDIDHHSARSLREKIDTALFYYRPQKLRLVLSEVSFMDSSGLGLILGRYTRMKELGGTLVLVAPTAQTVKILALAGMDKSLPIETK